MGIKRIKEINTRPRKSSRETVKKITRLNDQKRFIENSKCDFGQKS